MSTLSELFPSGGTQNSLDFVAQSAINNGQTVALRSDGKVEPVVQTTIGSSVSSQVSIRNPASGTGGTMSSAVPVFDAANNRYIVFWYDGYRCNLRAGAVAANGAITWGTTLGLGISYKSGFAWDSTQGYGMVVTSDNSYQVRVISIDSSNYITSSSNVWGGRAGGDSSYGPTVSFDPSSGRMLIFEAKDIWNSYGPICIPIEITGSSSITVGTATSISSNQTRLESMQAAYDSVNEITVVTRDVYGLAYPALVPITDTGSGGVTVGTAVRLGTTTEDGSLVVSMNGSEGVAVHDMYSGSGSTYRVVGYAFDVSGTTITAGSPTNFGSYASRTVPYSLGVTYENRSNTYVTTWNQQSGSVAYFALATKSSSSISWSSIGTINSTNPAAFVNGRRMTNAAAPSTSAGYGFILFPYITDSSGTRDYVYRLVTPSYSQSNSADFIGTANAAISSGATGGITVLGGLVTNQTGLTAGSDYFVQGNGTLGTTSTSVAAGKAISAQSISLVDL
jgi:hypothetical protein